MWICANPAKRSLQQKTGNRFVHCNLLLLQIQYSSRLFVIRISCIRMISRPSGMEVSREMNLFLIGCNSQRHHYPRTSVHLPKDQNRTRHLIPHTDKNITRTRAHPPTEPPVQMCSHLAPDSSQYRSMAYYSKPGKRVCLSGPKTPNVAVPSSQQVMMSCVEKNGGKGG